MLTSRWWPVVLGAMVAGTIAVLVIVGADTASIVTGTAISAVYAALFLLVRHRVRGCTDEEGSGWALALLDVTVLYAGAMTALQPEFAILQCLAYPLAWVLSRTIRGAILASAAVAVSVGIGFLVSLGASPAALLQIGVTQGISFAFSMFMGVWISRIAALGEEKARLLDELTEAQGELAALHRDAGVTSERARMSREVHDTVAQSLTGLVLLAQRARRGYAAGALDDETLELIETGARDALAETRALVAAAAPVELTSGGIADALQGLAERFERETRIRVSVDAALTGPLDRDTEVVLLRCAQEGLANVRKHSEAHAARVELTADASHARLRVVDDGRGFPAEVRPGFGLAGLRDRLALAGGTLEVDGTAGATAITATLPIGGAA